MLHRASQDGPTIDPRPYLPAIMPTRDPAGPEAVQRTRGRLARLAALISSGNAEHRQGLPVRIWRGQSLVSPQQLPPAVNLPVALAGAGVGLDFTRPFVPPRQPAAGWDGEAGATAPHSQV